MDFIYDIHTTISESIEVKKKLSEECSESIFETGLNLAKAISDGHKIMFCGNGGSAADSQHLAAELVVRLRSQINRPALPALALTVDASIMTAGGNDIGFENVFARCVEAYGKSGDILVGISTSGNSQNVIKAFEQAKQMGICCVGLLGGSGGSMIDMCDFKVLVPSSVTARIQESHILIGHIWCEMIEEYNFPELFNK